MSQWVVAVVDPFEPAERSADRLVGVAANVRMWRMRNEGIIMTENLARDGRITVDLLISLLISLLG